MLKLGYVLWVLLSQNCTMDDQKLADMLRIHEGERLLPYVDGSGKITIGIGRNLTDRGISAKTMECMFKEDVELAKDELDRIYPDWGDLSEDRQLVLMNMCFNLGAPRYLLFVKFWAALGRRDYEKAADEMLDSRWATQVGQRAIELSHLMREG